MSESKIYFEETKVQELRLKNLRPSTLPHPYRKSCQPQEEDSEEIKAKDNFCISNELCCLIFVMVMTIHW